MDDKNTMNSSFEDVFKSKRASFNKTCQLCWDKTLPQKIKELQHHYDTTIGLWCTDKPEAIPEDKKHLFFQLK